LYLKSLTVRGFKSFASSTTLLLEPGITCIVGPNGSGKSNVVDALAWVMGEQGAKSLRGGKMEDVIFSGTAGRPPLGRAEVVLTIDNTDGALPIDYAEVTLSRTMFRNGGSEYAINGSPCRLLDVQDLLSDSGIGREMHVIVGQGQLDSILRATPEDRRGFVEEAAGVLKHRKRKEKALRKLDATDGNLTRLTDLLTEIRRQLKPLGRQAEVALRASKVQLEVRDARARLLAADAVQLTAALEHELSAEREVHARREQVETSLADVRRREEQAELKLRATAPELTRAHETWYGLMAVRERVRGTANIAAERLRNLGESSHGDQLRLGVVDLEAEAGAAREQESSCLADVDERRLELGSAIAARQQAEAAAAAEERRVAGGLRVAADRREGLARLVGRVDAMRSRTAATAEELGRLTGAREEALARADRARHDFTVLETRIAGLDAGERGLDAEYEGATAQLRDLDDRLAKLTGEAHDAERERAALKARAEALDSSLQPRDGTGAVLAAAAELPGLVGSVAEALSVRRGYEAAVAAALGPAADAVAVDDLTTAVRAVELLKTGDLGRSGLLVRGAASPAGGEPRLPGETYVLDVVHPPAALGPVFQRLLADTVVVDDLAAARDLVIRHPEFVAVTRDGDRLGRHLVSGGSASSPGTLETRAAVQEARATLEQAAGRCERLRFERNAVEAERAETARRVDVALAKLHESDAVLAAVAEELSQLSSLARGAKDEAERIATAVASAEAARDSDAASLLELEAQLAAVPDSDEGEPDSAERDRLAAAARAARQAETDARLGLRTAEERARAMQGRVRALEKAVQEERAARARAAERQARMQRESRSAAAVAAACDVVLPRLDSTLGDAAERRTRVEASRSELDALVSEARQQARVLEAELATLTDSAHREEMMRTEYRLRREQLELRSRDELGLDLDALVADYGPDQPIPVLDAAPDSDVLDSDVPDTVPFVREDQEKRLRAAERDLAHLGRINPLALEEFSALEERHSFLSEQLDDLRRTRSDLLGIVKDVDSRVEEVFAAAYADVAREFATVFDRLFPGGEGRLVLTDPDDLLATGIDVEARPPGKRVKRLSLLSGGERSLVAAAFLVALFKARPSPFYILDEVEAALDDTNLGRLLEIYEELRETSQLLVITHQKRTMSIADALYGVSMRGDGVTTVISQRLREPASA
jgi:chromosome segregation protein